MIKYKIIKTGNSEAIIERRLNLFLFCIKLTPLKAVFVEKESDYIYIPLVGPMELSGLMVNCSGYWHINKDDFYPSDNLRVELNKIKQTYSKTKPRDSHENNSR